MLLIYDRDQRNTALHVLRVNALESGEILDNGLDRSARLYDGRQPLDGQIGRCFDLHKEHICGIPFDLQGTPRRTHGGQLEGALQPLVRGECCRIAGIGLGCQQTYAHAVVERAKVAECIALVVADETLDLDRFAVDSNGFEGHRLGHAGNQIATLGKELYREIIREGGELNGPVEPATVGRDIQPQTVIRSVRGTKFDRDNSLLVAFG